MLLLLSLAACIDVGFVKQDDGDAPFEGDTADSAFDTAVDTAVDTADSADTSADTSIETGDTGGETAETADTAVDTAADTSGDTSVDTADETGGDTAPDTADTGGTPPSIVLDGVCSGGYPYTSWADPAATEPELHIIGVYESQAGSGGPVSVKVSRTAEIVLVLTSYSAVDWQIDLDAAHNVTPILVSSYDPATWAFTGAGTAPVSYVGWIGECGYEIPDMDPYSGCETPDLQATVEATTGLVMASFQGCYAGGDYSIEE